MEAHAGVIAGWLAIAICVIGMLMFMLIMEIAFRIVLSALSRLRAWWQSKHCAYCRRWLARKRAVRLGSGTFRFCSPECSSTHRLLARRY